MRGIAATLIAFVVATALALAATPATAAQAETECTASPVTIANYRLFLCVTSPQLLGCLLDGNDCIIECATSMPPAWCNFIAFAFGFNFEG